MRILLIAHGYPPGSTGGTEIYTHDLARAFVAGGDEVFVLAREDRPELEEYHVRQEEREGVQLLFINHSFARCRSFAETYRHPAVATAARPWIDGILPDVVHIQHLTCLSTTLVTELAAPNRPVFVTLNDYWHICHRGQLLDPDLKRCGGPNGGCRRCLDGAATDSTWYRLAEHLRRRWSLTARLQPLHRLGRRLAASLTPATRTQSEIEDRARHMRWTLNQATGLLAPSQTLLRRFVEFGLDERQLVLIQQGIDHSPFRKLERTTSHQLRIGFFGSLMVSKAPHLLLEAFSKLASDRAVLKIYGGHASYHGDDRYRDQLEPLLAMPGVQYHGALPHREIPPALASVDVAVVPSIWLENAPFVIREAFVAGVPVVASDLGGMAEMVEQDTSGLLFQPGDADDLRRTLQRLLDEPKLLPRLRSNLPAMMTIEEDAEQLLELYRRALARPSSAPNRGNLAAVVLNYQTAHETVMAVRSLQSSNYPIDEITVVDNGSCNEDLLFLRRNLPKGRVHLIETGTNLGFSGGVNVGIRRALDRGADFIFLANADVVVPADTLAHLVSALETRPGAGVAGPTTLSAHCPQCVVSTGTSFSPWTGRMRHLGVGERYDLQSEGPTGEVDGVDGCAMLIRRTVLEEVGLFEEDYFFSFEDLDFCLRARSAGFSTLCVGKATIYHLGSRSIGHSSSQRLYFATRNHLLLAARCSPTHPLAAVPRAFVILALNVLYAALRFPGSRVAALGAVGRGCLHYLRRRYGDPAGHA